MVEEKKLVAEEQGGFGKGIGCRDQLMTLVLLGKMKAVMGRGMFASFVDFKEAYDRVDQGELWGCLKRMGIGGRALAFLKAAYTNLSCEVKVGTGHSDPFEVPFGLMRGCILSPLLVSLFINSVVTRLKEVEVGAKCGGKLISMLLYADDAVIFAEDEKSMRLGLDVRACPKLEVMWRLMDCECKARCVEIDCKRQRRMLMKLRGGTVELRIETGRRCGLRRDERICKMCERGEVEDVEHFFTAL